MSTAVGVTYLGIARVYVFGDSNTFSQKGGLSGMGKASVFLGFLFSMANFCYPLGIPAGNGSRCQYALA